MRRSVAMLAPIVFTNVVMAQSECPDQMFETPPETVRAPINGAQDRAQTFTVGLDGQLGWFDVRIARDGLPAGPLLIDLRETVDGVPLEDDSQVLSSLSLEPEDVLDDFVIVTLDVRNDNVLVVAGDVLAIVLRSPDSGSEKFDPTYEWRGHGAPNDPYPRGRYFWRSRPNQSTWSDETDPNPIDLHFVTYMMCETPVIETSWGSAKATYR